MVAELAEDDRVDFAEIQEANILYEKSVKLLKMKHQLESQTVAKKCNDLSAALQTRKNVDSRLRALTEIAEVNKENLDSFISFMTSKLRLHNLKQQVQENSRETIAKNLKSKDDLLLSINNLDENIANISNELQRAANNPELKAVFEKYQLEFYMYKELHSKNS